MDILAHSENNMGLCVSVDVATIRNITDGII